MSDRELLELAAKAAQSVGANIINSEAGPQVFERYAGSGAECYRVWLPLTDDGDCARLESACRINVEWQRMGVVAQGWDTERIREAYADNGGDRTAARRRASVRAAAEIGKAVP